MELVNCRALPLRCHPNESDKNVRSEWSSRHQCLQTFRAQNHLDVSARRWRIHLDRDRGPTRPEWRPETQQEDHDGRVCANQVRLVRRAPEKLWRIGSRYAIRADI